MELNIEHGTKTKLNYPTVGVAAFEFRIKIIQIRNAGLGDVKDWYRH